MAVFFGGKHLKEDLYQACPAVASRDCMEVDLRLDFSLLRPPRGRKDSEDEPPRRSLLWPAVGLEAVSENGQVIGKHFFFFFLEKLQKYLLTLLSGMFLLI